MYGARCKVYGIRLGAKSREQRVLILDFGMRILDQPVKCSTGSGLNWLHWLVERYKVHGVRYRAWSKEQRVEG